MGVFPAGGFGFALAATRAQNTLAKVLCIQPIAPTIKGSNHFDSYIKFNFLTLLRKNSKTQNKSLVKKIISIFFSFST